MAESCPELLLLLRLSNSLLKYDTLLVIYHVNTCGPKLIVILTNTCGMKSLPCFEKRLTGLHISDCLDIALRLTQVSKRCRINV